MKKAICLINQYLPIGFIFEGAQLNGDADVNARTQTQKTVGQSQHNYILSTHSTRQIYILGRSIVIC